MRVVLIGMKGWGGGLHCYLLKVQGTANAAQPILWDRGEAGLADMCCSLITVFNQHKKSERGITQNFEWGL